MAEKESCKMVDSSVASKVDQHFARALFSSNNTPSPVPVLKTPSLPSFPPAATTIPTPTATATVAAYNMTNSQQAPSKVPQIHHQIYPTPKYQSSYPAIPQHQPPSYSAIPQYQPPSYPAVPSYPVPVIAPAASPAFPPPAQAWPHLPPRAKDKGLIVLPQFSNYLMHPEVDLFSDIPRLPGENLTDEENFESYSNHLESEDGETWLWPAVGLLNHHQPPALAQSVVDELKLTDQELDNILELKGEL